MVFARVQAQPATQNHRQDGACAGEQQRVPKPLCNEYSHRLRIGKGITQVSMKQIDDVFPQLHMKRLIQAKLNGQRLNHILRNRIGSGQNSHGVTRSQLDNQKVYDDDYEYNKECRNHLFQNIPLHLRASLCHNEHQTGAGKCGACLVKASLAYSITTFA